jgi:photoactive yellow protein
MDGPFIDVFCAWCGRRLASVPGSSETPSHGICVDCLVAHLNVPINRLGLSTAGELDELPLGVVLLNRDGRITAYNQAEAALSRRTRESVLGRNFFTEVAPCTNVQDFKGKFDELVANGSGEATFGFVFAFPGRKTCVSIRCSLAEGSETVCLLVSKVAEQND